jgi:hypothetical protein
MLSISLLSATCELFGQTSLRIVQRYAEERNLINASQLSFRARHITTFQCRTLTDCVTFRFSNVVSGFGILG